MSEHLDCKNYLAIDVFKGICKVGKTNVNADEASCDQFEAIQKCRHCVSFSLKGEDLGLCMDRYDAYPEMVAKTCEDFQWIEKN
jgi:4-hydroxyphenylacetate decarboxylase small subunit